MTTAQITANIRSAMRSGKLFNVTFIKKNGEVRNMTARMGVKKGQVNTPGVASSTAHIPSNKFASDELFVPKYLTVFEMKNDGYRNVNTDAILDFKCGVVVETLNGGE